MLQASWVVPTVNPSDGETKGGARLPTDWVLTFLMQRGTGRRAP